MPQAYRCPLCEKEILQFTSLRIRSDDVIEVFRLSTIE
jgi:hypothetical protein